MPKESSKSKPRFNPKILVMFLMLGVTPLIVGHLVLTSGSRDTYEELISTYLGHLAEYAQKNVLGYLERVSAQTANLATAPAIQAVVRQSNLRAPAPGEFDDRLQQIEQEWSSLEAESSAFLQEILGNPASVFLREYNNVVAGFREIMVTDVNGRLVATSNKTTDYYQGDEQWWRAAYLEGEGGRFIGDIRFDESANAYGLDVAEPIRDSETGAVIGVIKTLVDSNEIYGLITSLKLSPETEAILMQVDGTVIFSTNPIVGYEFADDFRLGMEGVKSTVAQEERAFTDESENQLVFMGLPQSRFRDQLPELDWVVVMQGPYEEIFAPFENINRGFLYIVVFSAAVVLVLTAVFSWMMAKPALEIDPHLERL